jgi:hypothetical protein
MNNSKRVVIEKIALLISEKKDRHFPYLENYCDFYLNFDIIYDSYFDI